MEGLTRPPLFKEHDIAYSRMVGKRFFALFSDLGTAKTYMLIRDMLSMWQADLVDGMLVIAPVDVYRQWIDEELPAATDVECATSAWPELPYLEPCSEPRIWVIYPEAFRRKQKIPKRKLGEDRKAYRERRAKWIEAHLDAYEFCKSFLESGRMGLVVDESQMAMTAGSKTSRRIRALKPYAKYRRIASGFPNPKGQIDLYPQYSILSTQILKCTTKGQFVEKFCEMGGFRGQQIVGDKNEDEFNALVAPHTYTVNIEDCRYIDPKRAGERMPGRSWETVPVELTKEQRRLVEQVKKEFRAVIGKNTILMPMALQRLTRIQQIACGFLPELDNLGKPTGKLIIIPENRTAVLEHTLERIRGKVIIWSRFTYCTKRLAKHFGKMAVEYRGGGMDRAERVANKERFMRDPKCVYMFAQPRNAGTGLNGLTIARHGIYWSNDHNASIRRQTERRQWRIGQNRACWYGDLIAEGTYDKQTRDALVRRQNVAQNILANIANWKRP